MTNDRLGEVLDATYECLTRYGVRRTTVEDIAAAAGMSRTAVYQYVRSKDDAFRRLAVRLHERALVLAREASVGDDPDRERPMGERIRGVLEAKMNLVVALAGDSPHTAELLDQKARLFGDICHQFSQDIRGLLVDLFDAAPVRGVTPVEAADICMALVIGLEGANHPAPLLSAGIGALLEAWNVVPRSGGLLAEAACAG
jgi:AcrR family transcriptional regulator